MQDEDFDVAVIGCGPTGATLALLLAQQGLRVLALDREAGPCQQPRAVHFDAEVMRVWQWIGLAEPLLALTAPHPGMRFVAPDGTLLLDWPRPQETGPQGWRGNFRFHQPELETLLREALARAPGITLRPRCEAFLVEDRGDHVDLRFENMATGRVGRASARYVVGADGARSLVRRFIDTPMEDLGFHERWLVVDALLHRDRPDLGPHTVQYCNPARPATYSPGPGGRRRWEIAVHPQDEPMTEARAWALLRDWITPDEASLERVAVYTFHALVAQDWRRGRLLLAGDACHQTPPFMGQGLCAGVRDAANLFWKLALACRDHPATEALLASYTTERRPNAREYVATAVRLGRLINAADSGAALRAALPGAADDGPARMHSIAPPLGAGLSLGPLAGRLFGQPRMADGRRLDEALPGGFVLVAESALPGGERARLPPGLACVTPTEAPDAAVHLARLGARATILRPDRHTLGAADTAGELAHLIARALPYLQPETAPT